MFFNVNLKKRRQRETCFKNEERQMSDKRDRSGEPHGGAQKQYKQCINSVSDAENV